MDPELQEIIYSDRPPEQEIEAIIRLKEAGRYPPGIRVISEFKEIITCRLPKGEILPVYRSQRTASMKAAKFIGARAHPQRADRLGRQPPDRRPTGFPTGKGVVFGIIDWSPDIMHPNFIDPEKGTRFLGIWDQAHPEGLDPYGYGKLHTREAINTAMRKPYPYRHLDLHPGRSDSLGIGSHGVHVSDIAVGNGRLGSQGFAPDSDIVFVHLSSKGGSRLQNLGDSVRILEAIDFIGKMAGDRKLVINMSLGRMGGPKEGLTLVEQGIDRFLELKNNRIIVQSSGNYYLSRTHHSGRVKPGRSASFSFIRNPRDLSTDEMEVWHSEKDSFEIVLEHQSLSRTFRCGPDRFTNIRQNGNLIGRIYYRTGEPNNHLFRSNINVFLYKGAPSGEWKVTLHGRTVLDGRYHAWIERDGGCAACQSRFKPEYVDRSSTQGTICNGYRSLVIGAYNGTVPGFALSSFSSEGPTADGRAKPDLVAPGVRILAAKSTPRNQQRPVPGLTRMSGTSMATPHVSGSIAAMLEMIPMDISAYEIKSLVMNSTRPVPPHLKNNMRVGSGIFSPELLMNNARKWVGNKLGAALIKRIGIL